MDEDNLELDYTRWQQFEHGASALMGFIQASIPDQEARIDFRVRNGWNGDNIATEAVINVWDTAALAGRGIIPWVESLGWERHVYENNSEAWHFLLQVEPDVYK